jgi:hypothetical protein
MRLVALDHTDVRGPFDGDEEVDMLALGVHRVGGHDMAGQGERTQQRPERGDVGSTTRRGARCGRVLFRVVSPEPAVRVSPVTGSPVIVSVLRGCGRRVDGVVAGAAGDECLGVRFR